MKAQLKAWLTARYGTDDPEKLNPFEIYLCFAAGKDRKRLFCQTLKGKMPGKNKERSMTRVITTHVTLASWKARRGKCHGIAKVSSPAYMVYSASTLKHMPLCSYPHHKGLNRSDMFGPIVLQPYSEIPQMKKADKIEYLGNR